MIEQKDALTIKSDFSLSVASNKQWVQTVLNDFNTFLLDHAACERKASAMAMTLIAHYPDKQQLVTVLMDVAIEELQHFKQVIKIIQQRGLCLGPDSKDPYIQQLHQCVRRGTEYYFLDRLLIASIVEARGAERFALLAEALPEPSITIHPQNYFESDFIDKQDKAMGDSQGGRSETVCAENAAHEARGRNAELAQTAREGSDGDITLEHKRELGSRAVYNQIEPLLKNFYHTIAKSEERHYEIFLELALCYFSVQQVQQRLEELLVEEANIIQGLALRAALH